MKIEFFETEKLRKNLPKSEDNNIWKRYWNGNFSSVEFRSDIHVSMATATHQTTIDCIDEGAFEDCCILSILKDIKKEEITFLELGAGWGAQTADIDGIIKNRLIDTPIKKVDCYAVEAEPFHYKWLQQMIWYNRISATTLFGAADEKCGFVHFLAKCPSGDSYGQSVNDCGNLEVPSFSVDYIIEMFKINCVDIIHMDVQGNEVKVLKGAEKSINESKIDYIMIGTHKDDYNEIIRNMLPQYECVVDFAHVSGFHTLGGFPKPINIPQDGIQVFKRKI
jgi:FkbM family methyltransferase